MADPVSARTRTPRSLGASDSLRPLSTAGQRREPAPRIAPVAPGATTSDVARATPGVATRPRFDPHPRFDPRAAYRALVTLEATSAAMVAAATGGLTELPSADQGVRAFKDSKADPHSRGSAEETWPHAL
jgi:hypothetical protein